MSLLCPRVVLVIGRKDHHMRHNDRHSVRSTGPAKFVKTYQLMSTCLCHYTLYPSMDISNSIYINMNYTIFKAILILQTFGLLYYYRERWFNIF